MAKLDPETRYPTFSAYVDTDFDYSLLCDDDLADLDHIERTLDNLERCFVLLHRRDFFTTHPDIMPAIFDNARDLASDPLFEADYTEYEGD